MSQPTVFVSADAVPADLRASLESDFRVVEVPYGTAAEDLPSYGSPVGWLVAGERVDAAVLAHLPELRAVSNYGVGYDSLDIDALRAAGIVAGNTPGVLDNAVSELTLGLILALGRQIVAFDRYTRDGGWIADGGDAPLTHDVHGTTVGIVGMGRIGSRLAELVRPLGITVIYHNRARRASIDESGLAQWREWDDFLRESDFVVLQVPLTERTRGFFMAEDFALMKQSAYLINMARGAVVDTPALIDAIRSGRIAGAALDVYEVEPLPVDHELQSLPNTILLPHIGSATEETRRAMVELAVDNLRNGVLGAPMKAPIL